MSRINTKYGHYHTNLDEEIHRVLSQLKEWGFDATYLEASYITAEKEKKARLSKEEAKTILSFLRGLK